VSKGKSMTRCSFCGSRKHASANCPIVRGEKRPPKRVAPSYEQNMDKLAKRRPPADYPASTDALSHRLPGSFEQGERQ
jgi:hypothetical protein